MDTRSLLPVFLLTGLLTSCQPRLLKVLCLGDSITQGKVQGDTIKELSYRYWLWEKLDSAGYKVDMVGNNPYWFTENRSSPIKKLISPYTDHPFDTDHEGFYGIKTGQSLNGGFTHDKIPYASLHERLKKIAAPDCAFVHIGTNDGQGDSLTTINSLKQIVEELYFRNAGMRIFLAKLNTPWVHFVNNAVEPLITELKTQHPKIKLAFVDMAAGWINCPEAPGAMTFDWVHPNEAGQKLMAENWFRAYQSIGDRRKPKFIANLRVIEQTDRTATISWSPATDNQYVSGYDVLLDGNKVNWHRSACGNKRNGAIALVPGTNFQLTELQKGASYTVRVVARDYADNSQISQPFTFKIE
jgi:lysophospholipase L1-like esterase